MNTATVTTLWLEPRSIYGLVKYYPQGEAGLAVTTLTGKKTVDGRDCRALESLGFAVRVVGRPDMPASEAVL